MMLVEVKGSLDGYNMYKEIKKKKENIKKMYKKMNAKMKKKLKIIIEEVKCLK